jgi:ankyrin repeat protein
MTILKIISDIGFVMGAAHNILDLKYPQAHDIAGELENLVEALKTLIPWARLMDAGLMQEPRLTLCLEKLVHLEKTSLDPLSKGLPWVLMMQMTKISPSDRSIFTELPITVMVDNITQYVAQSKATVQFLNKSEIHTKTYEMAHRNSLKTASFHRLPLARHDEQVSVILRALLGDDDDDKIAQMLMRREIRRLPANMRNCRFVWQGALRVAALTGRKETVRCLLDVGDQFARPWIDLISNELLLGLFQEDEITYLLVKNEIPIKAFGGFYGDALQVASFHGREEIVQFFIKEGAISRQNLGGCHGYYGSALQAASFSGHEKIVRLLLENGARLDDRAGYYGSALQAASFSGHEKIVRLLLENGARLDDRAGYYGSALQAASFSGHEKIVHLLLENGARLDDRTGYYGSALQAASFSGHEKIVKLLIEKGARLDDWKGHYGNALQAASFSGHERIVKLLIEKGARLLNWEGHYGSALQAASFSGHEKIVQLLIEKGARLLNWEGHYGSALQAASFSGHEKIVQLLIEKGARLDDRAGYYGTALQAASFSGHERIVKLLIEKGARLLNWEGHYGSALQAASFSGHEEIVALLIKQGAHLHTNEGYYGSALQAASFKGHENIVHFLIQEGADVNIYGGHYDNALQAASFGGHEKIVDFLIDHGAVCGGHYSCSTSVFSIGSHEEIVTFSPKTGTADDDALATQIAIFLLKKSFFQSLLKEAIQRINKIEEFEERLEPLLRRYGEELQKLATKPVQSRAASCLNDDWALRVLILALYSIIRTNDFAGDYIYRKEHRLSRSDLIAVEIFLASSHAPRDSFFGSVCRLVYSDPTEAVKVELLRGIENQKEPCRVQFHLSWKIDRYLEYEIIKTKIGAVDRRILTSLLTLSGDTSQCFANSCNEYMKWRWPNSYKVLLKAIIRGSNGGKVGK